MTTPPKAIFNWSGGKDSALALYHILEEGKFEVETLLTTLSSAYKRVSMHGVREELLEAQAANMGIALQKIYLPETASMEEYNRMMFENLSGYSSRGIRYSLFGDIFLEDLRKYREAQLVQVNMEAIFPLWGRNTRQLAEEFIDLGFKAIIVCVNDRYLDKSFAGRMLDRDFLNDLPAGTDPCGENGEFHSFVFDGPLFSHPVDFTIGETVFRKYESPDGEKDSVNYDTGFYYCDLVMG